MDLMLDEVSNVRVYRSRGGRMTGREPRAKCDVGCGSSKSIPVRAEVPTVPTLAVTPLLYRQRRAGTPDAGDMWGSTDDVQVYSWRTNKRSRGSCQVQRGL